MTVFYLDNCVPDALAIQLRLRRHQAIYTRDIGPGNRPDWHQLLISAQNSWVLVTNNSRDFTGLHEAWLAWSAAWSAPATHSGILVLKQHRLSPSEWASEIDAFMQTTPELDSQLYNWTAARRWERYLPRTV